MEACMLKSIILLTTALAFMPLMAMEEGDNERAGLDALPDEAKLHILNNLDPKDLATTGRLNKSWKGLSDDESLWRGLSEKEKIQKKEGQTWKESYKDNIHVEKVWRKLKRDLEDIQNQTEQLKKEKIPGYDPDVLQARFHSFGPEDLLKLIKEYNYKIIDILLKTELDPDHTNFPIRFDGGVTTVGLMLNLIMELDDNHDPRVEELKKKKYITNIFQLTEAELIIFICDNQLPALGKGVLVFDKNKVPINPADPIMKLKRLEANFVDIIRNFAKEYEESTN